MIFPVGARGAFPTTVWMSICEISRAVASIYGLGVLNLCLSTI